MIVFDCEGNFRKWQCFVRRGCVCDEGDVCKRERETERETGAMRYLMLCRREGGKKDPKKANTEHRIRSGPGDECHDRCVDWRVRV